MPSPSGHQGFKGDFPVSCISKYFCDLLILADSTFDRGRVYLEDLPWEKTEHE